MSLHEIQNCPKCNNPFECKPYNISECQCLTIQLTIAQKSYLEAKFEDCLCYNCLVQLQEDDS